MIVLMRIVLLDLHIVVTESGMHLLAVLSLV